MSVYGDRLRRARVARQIDQITLAQRAGVAQSYISALESGRKSNPGLLTFERLATGLGITLGALLGITSESGRKPPSAARPVVRDHSPAAQHAALAQALARIEEMP